jgi:hypothetical protein
MGKMAGVPALIKALVPFCSSSHCVLHASGENNVSHSENVLDDTVKIVNHIKSKLLNARLFRILCEEMGSEHTSLLLQTEVRCVYRRNVLGRVFELHTEISEFSVEHNFFLSHCFSSSTWLHKLAYFAHIFMKVNELNLSLQGNNGSIFTVRDKISPFQGQLEFYGTT